MKNSNSALPVLLLLVCVGNAAGQSIDSLRRHSITISAFALTDRTLGINYAYRFKNGRELTISSRARFAEPNPRSNETSLIIGSIMNSDPRWYYNQVLLRGGIMFPMGHGFFFEPQIQLGYAFFNGKVLKVDDSTGEAYDKSIRLDRNYFTGGVINNVCWVMDRKRLRVKMFVGLGGHGRKYYEAVHENIYYHRTDVLSPPEKSTYWQYATSFHLGLDLGFRF